MMVSNICCLGWGRNNGRLGIQRQLGSYNIDSLVSKENQAMFALLVERLTYHTCVASADKSVEMLLERGVALIFKGEKMTHIISLNTTLKSPQNQKASEKPHKKLLKGMFHGINGRYCISIYFPNDMMRSADYREPLGLCLFRWRQQSTKRHGL